MKPFNLERALAGDKVVTRSGKEINQLHQFNVEKSQFSVFAVVCGRTECFTESRRFFGEHSEDSEFDLFMASEQKECWINIYKGVNGKVTSGEAIYYSKQAAIDQADETDLIAAVKISWEE